ncbi:hypothetical protein RvY_04511 [Ramazzottius varieornatus]|uniref:Major facilitator superfamily associated domain-containing protein n=1 Tax=Ramazzottius varieornatus TaxID=947166 RepID=A0A1D1URU5_RAMVA|nr:hypothetical protein RvY_04511 [Ramazzottius varieornatus]
MEETETPERKSGLLRTTKPFRQKLRELFQINYKLLPLKIILFAYNGAATALYPFMTIHMKSLGLTLTEIALIYAVMPFVSFVGPPIGGWLADRIGNYKAVFMTFLAFTAVSHVLLMFVPPIAMANTIVDLPLPEFTLTYHCSNSSSYFSHKEYQPISPNSSASIISLPKHALSTGNESPKVLLQFMRCATTCPDIPVLCLYPVDNLSPADCSIYSDFEGRYLTNGSITINAGGETTWSNFHAEKGQPVSSVACSAATSADCAVTCSAQPFEHELVLRQYKIVPGDRTLTLTMYIVIRYLAAIGMQTVFPMMDALAYQMSKEHKGDLGMQRTWSLIGMAALTPISGYFVQLASRGKAIADYSPTFYIFGLAMSLATIMMCFVVLEKKPPSDEVGKNVVKILKKPKVAVFVTIMFITGCFWGFIENFIFVYLEELGSPKWFLGFTTTISCLAALPVVAASTFFIRKFGHWKLICFVLVLYGFRFLGYSFLQNPFYVVPIEVLEAFTTSLLWVVASTYTGKIAPDYLASVQSIQGGAHAAFGRGIGSLIGGIMFDHLKPRMTYRIFAVASFCVAALYGLVQMTCLRRKRSRSQLEVDEGREFYETVGPRDGNSETSKESEQSPLSKEETTQLEQCAVHDALGPHVGGTYRGTIRPRINLLN